MISIKVIDNEKLSSIKGGATFTVLSGVVVAAIAIFLSGVIEGITNPERCNS